MERVHRMLREHEKITAHIIACFVALKRASVNLDVSAVNGINCSTLKEFQLVPHAGNVMSFLLSQVLKTSLTEGAVLLTNLES